MVLRQADGQTIVEKRWGRLRYGILPVHTKKMAHIFPDRQIGLEQFMKTLSQKEKRGYILSDELRLT
jgi:predicted DNA-binding WGR domain protein